MPHPGFPPGLSQLKPVNSNSHPWEPLKKESPCAIGLGLFDGVHVGHQEILKQVREAAERMGVVSRIFSFQNHPMSVLGGADHHPPRFLVSPYRRRELIEGYGIEEVLLPEFTLEWSQTPADVFAKEVLVETLRAKHVVIGFNYCFGRKAEGRAADMIRLGEELGFTVEIVPAFKVDGIDVSSTRIRKAVKDSEIEEAHRLLGRPHELTGLVVQGDGRGTILGYPTANLSPELEPLLPNGVYAVHVRIPEVAEVHRGMFFLGPRKTFGESDIHRSAEVHLLDFHGDLYGKKIRVELLGRIRKAIKFNGPDELVEQLERDRENCEPFFQEHAELRDESR